MRTNLSAAALRAIFSQHADDTFVTMLTIYGSEIEAPIRISDNFTHRFEHLDETQMTVKELDSGTTSGYTFTSDDAVLKEALLSAPDDVFYGVLSTKPYLYIPFAPVLPSDEEEASPRAKIDIFDATRQLTPMIRSITSSPSVMMEIALLSTPALIEFSFDGLLLGSITYNRDQVSGDLTVESDVAEPFPAYAFTPSYFPGLF